MINSAVSMRELELELESVQLLPRRETLFVARFHGGHCGGYGYGYGGGNCGFDNGCGGAYGFDNGCGGNYGFETGYGFDNGCGFEHGYGFETGYGFDNGCGGDFYGCN
jgi:hypothetical protein